jgi:hypothetical protein
VALEDHIRDIPDFPKPGIVFKDITPLFLDASALREAVDALVAYGRDRDAQYVVSAEARGFVLGAAVAVEVGATSYWPASGPNPGDGYSHLAKARDRGAEGDPLGVSTLVLARSQPRRSLSRIGVWSGRRVSTGMSRPRLP